MRRIETNKFNASDSFGGWEPTIEVRERDYRLLLRVARSVETAMKAGHQLPVDVWQAFHDLNKPKGKR
jgi:hypothetical protein